MVEIDHRYASALSSCIGRRAFPRMFAVGWAICIHAHAPAEFEQSEAEQAENAYRQALALATELGMRPLVAHCHLGLGKLHASPHPQPLSRPSPYPLPQAGEGPSLSGERVATTSQREKAREHLATATTLYREMDMRFWLEQAEHELQNLA